jgi:hypothetical protein
MKLPCDEQSADFVRKNLDDREASRDTLSKFLPYWWNQE